MNIVSQINYYSNVLIFASIFVAAIFAALIFYFVKVRKIQATEEKINYENFNQFSSMDYCKFDDIIIDQSGRGIQGAGMIVVDKNTFITGIDVIGYNYEHASPAEKQRTMIKAVAFANIIDEPIQIRQTVSSIDIQASIDQYEESMEGLTSKLAELRKQYLEMALQLEARREEPEIYEQILKNIEKNEAQQRSLTWKIRQCENVLRYEKTVQNSSTATERVNQVMFSYKYNPDDYTEELDETEIYIKAMASLKTKISVFSSALASCGCSCRPLTANQIINLMYRHMHPETADTVKVEDILEANTRYLFTSSDSLFELEKERLGEDGYFDMMNENDAYLEEEFYNAQDKINNEINEVEDMLDRYAEKISGGEA